MNSSDTSPSILARWLGRRPRAEDAADYGTAFGLDLSMEEGLPGPADAPSSAAPAPLPGWFALWLHF